MNQRIFCLFIAVSILFLIGLVVIFSTTSAEVLDQDLKISTHHALYKQIIYFIAGVFVLLITYRYGYQAFINKSPIILGMLTLLLILILIPGIGKEVNGAKRWLQFFGLQFQPSEFVKVALPAFFIYAVSKEGAETISFGVFFKALLIAMVPIVLVAVEPNNGTAFVMFLSLIALFFLLGIKAKYWAVPLVVIIVAGGAFASQMPYVKGRMRVYLNPEADLLGRGHQPYQAKIATGSGKLIGKGPGRSLQKLSYLPEAQNDYIAAIYAEEFGFIGISLLIFLYCFLIYCGFSIASLAQDKAGFNLAGVLTFLIGFQAFLNLGVVSGLLPSTGLNLPLFSQGGSSLIANLTEIGLLASILPKVQSRNHMDGICQKK